MADKNVKAVLINIFGGILRCDVLAQGVIAAVKELGVPVPIVIRMEGTNVEEGKRMLKESGLNFTTADSMGEAAEKVVALRKGEEVTWRSSSTRTRGSSSRGSPAAKARSTPRRPRPTAPRRRRRHARQGRHDARGLADLQQRARRGARDRRERDRHLRAAAVCGRRDHGSGRRGHPAGRLHHRRHSGRRHAEGDDLHGRASRRGSSGRTARASSRRARRRPASFPATSARKAASASSRRAAR